MPGPLVSICIPTRNRASSLRESVAAIAGQDYPSLDILVSDNCSDDDTQDVVRQLMREDSRIRYVRHSVNIGLHGNHNFCMDAARGEFLCVWHDHDLHDRHLVGEYVGFLQAHPEVGVVCSDWDLVDDAGERVGVREHKVKEVVRGLEYIDRTIRSGRTSIGIPGAMVRREALGTVRFVPEAPIGFGDFPVWFRVAETWHVGHIPRRLWSWRQNSESHSARTIESMTRDYHLNVDGYCDDHLARWPGHAALVTRWRANLRHYLFWALAYEIALHARHSGPARPLRDHAGDRSLFEIMDYRLSPEQFAHALAQLKEYRTSPLERVTYAGIMSSITLRCTRPMAWMSRHHVAMRALLRLE